MHERIGKILGLALVLMVPGCSGKQPGGETKEKAELSRLKDARIVVRVPGDDIGSPESKTVLEEIKATLIAHRVGDIVSSGFGMGTIEIVVAMGSDKSVNELRQVMDNAFPKEKYRIEQTTK